MKNKNLFLILNLISMISFCFISYLVFGTYGSTVIISAKHAISHLAEIEPLFNRERGEARQTRRR